MKKLIFITLLIGSILNFNTDWFELFQADYFVSETGSDSNSGVYPWAAWQTVSKVNATTFSAGDRIAFKAGDEWCDTLSIRQSGTAGNPIIFKSYGSGVKPKITGFVEITSGWRSETAGLYSHAVTVQTAPKMVTINDTVRGMGRWPNTGWRTFTSHSGTTQITDPTLTNTPDWDSARVVIRKNRWIMDSDSITSHSTTQINYTNVSGYTPVDGYGYFIQNDLTTLDTYGEWFYSYAKGRIYVYFGANDPTTKLVKVSKFDKGFKATGKNYITIRDIALEGFNVGAMYFMTDPSYFTIENCDFTYSGLEAIHLHFPDHCTITGNTFNWTNSNAIGSYDSSTETVYNVVSNNTITNTGLIAGLNGNGDRQSNAIMLKGYTGANNLIEYNTITNSGYIPIVYGGENTIVRYNFIDRYCLVKDDGGGIYTTADSMSGKQVYNNIILHGIGNGDGTANTTSTQGLYGDLFSSGINAHDNTVAYIANFGFHSNVNNVMATTIRNNNFLDCSNLLSLQRWPATGGYPTGLTVTQNNVASSRADATYGLVKYFVNKESGSDLYYYNSSLTQEMEHMADIDSNYYYVDLTKAGNVKSNNSTPLDYHYSPTTWKAAYTHDANSTYQVFSADSAFYTLQYNATKLPVTIALADTMKDLRGNQYNTSVTLQPYTSVILYNEAGYTPPASTLNDNLVSTWLLDETSGTTANDAKSVNNLTVTGATVNQTGKIGKAYSFDGNDYVGNITAYEYTNAMTVSCWFKTSTTGTNMTLVANYDNTTNNGWRLYRSSSNTVYMTVGDGTSTPTSISVTTGTVDAATEWVHVVGTFDGTYARIYIDGTKINTSSAWNHNITYTANNKFKLGYLRSSWYYTGSLDNVSIWNRVLSDSEIWDLAEQERTGNVYPY